MIANGTKVITKIDDKTTGWVEKVLKTRQNNVKGIVVDKENAHGLCYCVKHEDDTVS